MKSSDRSRPKENPGVAALGFSSGQWTLKYSEDRLFVHVKGGSAVTGVDTSNNRTGSFILLEYSTVTVGRKGGSEKLQRSSNLEHHAAMQKM